MKRFFLLCFSSLFIIRCCHAEDTTYAERLGYPKGARVLILHVDDVGMSFDSNEGAIEAMTRGVATSCSVMMPCSWVPAYVHYLKQHPQTDAGLHLTLTSEWAEYRWGPLAGKEKVPGLVDDEGDLWRDVSEGIKSLKPGLTMMIMHCTAPTEVFQHISGSGPLRRGDLLVMTNPAFKKALQDEEITLTTWRELMQKRTSLKPNGN